MKLPMRKTERRRVWCSLALFLVIPTHAHICIHCTATHLSTSRLLRLRRQLIRNILRILPRKRNIPTLPAQHLLKDNAAKRW